MAKQHNQMPQPSIFNSETGERTPISIADKLNHKLENLKHWALNMTYLRSIHKEIETVKEKLRKARHKMDRLGTREDCNERQIDI